MKTSKQSLIAVFFLSALGSSFAADIPNPGFEEGLGLWNIFHDNRMASAAAEAAHSGKLGLLIDDQDGSAGSYLRSGRIPVQPGDELRLRFFARNVSGFGMGVYLVFYNGRQVIRKTEEAVAVVPEDQNEWKEIQLLATVPEGATDACVLLHSSNRGRVVAHVDDLLLTNITTEE